MSSTARFLSYALVMLLGIAATCEALELTVRVISAKDGRPVVERHIVLECTRRVPPGERWSPEVFRQWAYTDGEGVAVFDVSLPLPADSSFFVGGLVHYCSPARFSPAEAIRTGVSVEFPCPHRPKGKFVVPPHPGEIVIYSGEYSRWEGRLYFPWPS